MLLKKQDESSNQIIYQAWKHDNTSFYWLKNGQYIAKSIFLLFWLLIRLNNFNKAKIRLNYLFL